MDLYPLVVHDFESMAPVVLTPQKGPMTDDEFVEFCEQYPDCMVECTAEGEIIIMPPTYSKTSMKNAWLGAQLVLWARRDGRGVVLDSSGGCQLPNGARRSADAAWVKKDRLPKATKGFFHGCPDFVVELRSTHDRLKRLQAKMEEYIANGSELGWLIDPLESTIWVYRPGRTAERLDRPAKIAGEACVTGFVLDLAEIWD